MSEYQHYTQYHESFPYNACEEKQFLSPQENKEDKNIKGIEFEIKDSCNKEIINNSLDELIERSIICSYDTMDEYRRKYANCIWTYDGTVDHELVVQAERPRNLALKMKVLNKFLNPENVANKPGTSTHIHLNNQYLRNLGLRDIDMVKAGEAVSSTLKAISGREQLSELHEWSKTRVNLPYETPIVLRSRKIDDIVLDGQDYNHHPGHYMMVNVENNNTTEVRIFSNKHSFNYDRVKLYLESCDMLIDIALAMQGLSYENNYEIVTDIVTDFYNHYRRKKYLYEVSESIIQDGEELYDYETKQIINQVNKRFENIMGLITPEMRELETLRILRDMENNYHIEYDGTINLNNLNINGVRENLITQIYNR